MSYYFFSILFLNHEFSYFPSHRFSFKILVFTNINYSTKMILDFPIGKSTE